ncbi:dephospho-CoA kinase [Primorskyibacter aestuariivivens]|uniref:dephospho-CoA kinase n=1 Tax=Primorskyibacter aestuariivivens TaxID=1888912 RepID=UPI00230004BE|nr:dephospho-CoA kinase [Primorskyibacter aestuariivivens]MDA7427679.1 dephospho-CoA kinase [Primorskyibacter aestuariivivens]
MTFRLGLTGSIGMGKSTTAQMFTDLGCALWDADAAVHRAYAPGGPAIAPIGAMVPEALRGDRLDRDVLRNAIRSDAELLSRIEAVVHPIVRADREQFLRDTKADIAVLDIPLLFETGAEAEMDAVAVVSVAPDIQKARVLERGTMSEDDFNLILSRQMRDAEKRKRADFVIETDTLEHARQQVETIVTTIRDGLADA